MANLAEIMRPNTLDEVLGNEPIVNALRKQLNTHTLSQSIMITGQYGSGKTSLAKIIASELNAHVTEIDCGSDGSVDRMREIVESSNYSSLFANKKVYILDEVHQLSKPGQSALLKTLEDAKPDVHFILLTTDPQKVLKTIRSRCVVYELKAATNKVIGEAVKRVEDKYNLRFENRADFWGLVEQSDGSLRQVYALMEKLIALADDSGFVSSANFQSILGSSSQEVPEHLPKAFLGSDIKAALDSLSELKKSEGTNPFSTTIGLYNYLKAVRLRSGQGKPQLLADLASLLANKDIDWYHLEVMVWRHL